MILTRRAATKLVLASPALIAPIAGHAASNKSWAARLNDDLNAAIKPGCNGAFRVVEFGQGKMSNGDILFKTVVELRWPPGLRRRPFEAHEMTDTGTYFLLLATVLSPFRKAWTYPDGTSCIA